MGVWIATGALRRVRLLNHPLWRRPCKLQLTEPMRRPLSKQIFPQFFASLELSRFTWLITSLSPGAWEKMSKRSILVYDVAGLLSVWLAQLKEKARGRTGRDFLHHNAIQEAADWTASGSTAFCRAKESKATLSMPRRF